MKKETIYKKETIIVPRINKKEIEEYEKIKYCCEQLKMSVDICDNMEEGSIRESIRTGIRGVSFKTSKKSPIGFPFRYCFACGKKLHK